MERRNSLLAEYRSYEPQNSRSRRLKHTSFIKGDRNFENRKS